MAVLLVTARDVAARPGWVPGLFTKHSLSVDGGTVEIDLFGWTGMQLKTTALNRPALLAAMAHYPPAPITPLARY